MMPLLAVDRLSFGYAGRVVGADVSFSLDPGEVLCLLGPNGGGKTTLLKTVLGLQPPFSGTVRIDGDDTGSWAPALRAQAIAYVPQAVSGAFPFSVHQIVLMGRTARLGLFDAPSGHDRAVCDEALEQVGIAALAGRPFTEISGGERQLVLIARALAQQARIMILDEPTASLDFANQARVLDLISSLARQGLAVVFSTHHPDQAFLVADKVAMLRGGRLIRSGLVADLLTEDALGELYGTPVSIAQVAGRTVCFAETFGG